MSLSTKTRFIMNNNYNPMIINESIMFNAAEKFQHRRYSLKKEADNRNPKHFSISNAKFLTERCDERHFSDYEIGKRIIKDLPELKIDKLKNRCTGYNRNFNIITLEKVKNSEEFVTKMERTKHQYSYEADGNDEASESNGQTSYTQFISKIRTQTLEQASRLRGYSMIIPILKKPSIKRTENSQMIKRKIFKNKRNSSSKIKNFKTEIIDPEHAISSFIKIEKKELNQVKVNRGLVNRFKLMNYDKSQNELKRTLQSRLEPWALSHNDIDFF